MSTPSPIETIHVDLGDRSYTVHVGAGVISMLGAEAKALPKRGSKCAIITDSNVAPLYSSSAETALRDAGFSPITITVPAGEASKSMEVVTDVSRQMIRAGLDRSAFIIALGGGVVGDLAGFVASIYFRGIPFIQVPTTIVSQVDSSVGGKTGVNAPEGKNLIGAFHQPATVLADTETLTTLPQREYAEGYGEVIKHAAIRDGAMLDHLPSPTEIDPIALTPLIARNVAIKARVVEEDERETAGVRALLNFGHTIGHGIEAAGGYGRFLHGEAISLGLHAALALSIDHAGLSASDAQAVASQLDHFGLPATLPPDISTASILDALKTDKKFAAGAIRFVLLRTLGDAYVSDAITLDHIETAIEALRA